jgi:hypothetical protein
MNIFEENVDKTRDTDKGLIIKKSQEKVLSKHQQQFNRLVKRIEKIRHDLERIKGALEIKMNFFQKNLYPLEKEILELTKEHTKLLFNVYKDKKLSLKKDRQIMREIIASQLSEIFNEEGGEPDPALEEIFRAVEGLSYKEAARESFMHMKSEIKNVFDNAGFKVNMKDFHPGMSNDEMMKKLAELQEALGQQQEDQTGQKRMSRKKTKKQLEKEERERQVEESRTKSISGIYRQLAKVLHPDLEQDEAIKLEKEELMKQLTIAYENNDLHTLLSLEIAWIQKEENNPGKLTDEKLDIYNEVLKEQVYELELELLQVRQNPAYRPLHRYSMFKPNIENIDLRKEKLEAEAVISDLKNDIEKLKGSEKEILSAVKKAIRDFELESSFDANFPFFGR